MTTRLQLSIRIEMLIYLGLSVLLHVNPIAADSDPSLRGAIPGGYYYAGGVGTHSCRVYLQRVKEAGNLDVYSQWAFGFISGLNRYASDQGLLLPPAVASDVVHAWLQQSCSYSG